MKKTIKLILFFDAGVSLTACENNNYPGEVIPAKENVSFQLDIQPI